MRKPYGPGESPRAQAAQARKRGYWQKRYQDANGDPKLLADIAREKLWASIRELPLNQQKQAWAGITNWMDEFHKSLPKDNTPSGSR